MLTKLSVPSTSIAVPPGFDPQAVPIQSNCAGEKAIANSQLQPDQLRQRFIAPPPWTPEITDENRHVFGVFFWFLMPLGPGGVVLYRLADMAAERWGKHVPNSLHLEAAARHFFYVLDWVPARLTAMSFALAGNFEDTIYAWRYLTHKWADELSAVILAAGSGALGVRLGEPLREPDSEEALRMAEAGEAPIYDVGLEPSERTLRSAIGLVWRVIIALMILLAMLTIAVWL